MAEFSGPGFLGAIGGILTGIGAFLRGFLSITTAQLLRLVQYLRDQLVSLSKALLKGVWHAARGLARALRSLGTLAYHGLKKFLLWADRKLRALERWLKDTFAPLLRKLRDIKQFIDDFYKKFLRPIIDTIEFIRQINHVLQLFHINVLRKLDSVLQQIERKIEDPFLWVRAHITQLENWINVIITGDGLFVRVAMLRSMGRYAPDWIKGFYNAQQVRIGQYPSSIVEPADDPPTSAQLALEAREYMERGTGPFSEPVERAVAASLENLGLRP